MWYMRRGSRAGNSSPEGMTSWYSVPAKAETILAYPVSSYSGPSRGLPGKDLKGAPCYPSAARQVTDA